jgi:signal transduction histidine kinase/CheY-like chemotaxis protein
MKTINVNEVSRSLDAILEDAGDSNDPIKIERHGEVLGAIISIEALELLQGLESDRIAAQSDQYREPVGRLDDNQGPRAVLVEGNVQQVNRASSVTSEERYQELFNDSPVAIWVEDWSDIKRVLDEMSTDGVEDLNAYFNGNRDQLMRLYGLADIVEISQAAVVLFHEDSVETLLGHTSPSEIVPEELDAFLKIILSFWSGSFSLEVESRDIDGNRAEMMIRRRVVIPPTHQAGWSRVIYAIEDITDRLRLEEQLRQAQKMEVVGQLTGGVAHDFNNLLAIISGNVEFLATATDVGNEYLEPILRATERGAALTQRLLAFSRTQALQTRTIDIGALVSEMSSLLTRTLGETIKIEHRAAPGLWHALADSGQLENALLNLSVNARDAMPSGGVLTIKSSNLRVHAADTTADHDLDPGDYVVMAVSDTGHGMTTAVQARAFEPFFTTKGVSAGSGLGLSMVYGFTKQLGGHVSISSERGHGTTVKLYLPRSGFPDAPIDEAQPGRDERGKGEWVLLIEDDTDVRSLTLKMLEHLGYQVIDVPDATTAHDALARGTRFDLVLSDVVLPGGIGGPEFAQQAIRKHPNLKVLFMSGYSAQTALGSGSKGEKRVLLNKPFRMEVLAKALRESLD